MSEVEVEIPALYGGISHQPAHIRHLTQVENAINAAFSVVDGASKRPGSRFIKKVAGLTAGGDYRLHRIDRDGTEQYLILYGPGTLRIFELLDGDALEATVNISADASAYLGLNSPTSDQLRLITVADYTFLLNTTVPVELESAPTYNIRRTYINNRTRLSDTVFSGYVRVSEGDGGDEEFYKYDVDYQFANVRCWGISGRSWAWASGSNWTDSMYNPGGFRIGFQRLNMDLTGCTWTQSTLRLSKTGAFANYEHRDGDQIKINSGTGVTPGWYGIEQKIDNDTIELTDSIAASDTANVATDAIGIYAEPHWNISPGEADTMHDIAAIIEDALEAAGAIGALCSWQRTSRQGGHFRITSPFRGSEATIFGPETPDASLVDFSQNGYPFRARTINAGTGSPPTDTLPPAERWTQVPPSGQPRSVITAAKMPMQIVRTSYTGDGSTPAVFDVGTVSWSSRGSGDEDTNPPPSIFEKGSTITDISFHRNRLVLAGGENIVFSQAGDVFNFWLDDHDNIVDSDPIDLALSSEQVTLVEYIVPFRKTLVLFTKAGRQFELNTPDALTPTTAAISPSTAYDTLGVRPEPMAHFLFFLARRKDAAILYQYFYDDSRVANTAADVTAHVFGLLPSDLRSLETSTGNETVAVLPNDCETIYIYREFWNGNEKQQAAWTKWVFDEDYRICDIAIIRNDLYMLVETTGGYAIEQVPISRQVL